MQVVHVLIRKQTSKVFLNRLILIRIRYLISTQNHPILLRETWEDITPVAHDTPITALLLITVQAGYYCCFSLYHWGQSGLCWVSYVIIKLDFITVTSSLRANTHTHVHLNVKHQWINESYTITSAICVVTYKPL